MSFDPQYAIVTASDSGIGKATAVALAQNGMDVGITWHSDSEGAEATAEEVNSHGRKAFVKQLDTTDLPSCAITIDLLIDELGGLDVFVNNAGTGSGSLLVDTSYDDWRRVIATNLDGAFVCMRQAAKQMVGRQRRPTDRRHQRPRAPATGRFRSAMPPRRHRRTDQDLRPGAGRAPDHGKRRCSGRSQPYDRAGGSGSTSRERRASHSAGPATRGRSRR